MWKIRPSAGSPCSDGWCGACHRCGACPPPEEELVELLAEVEREDIGPEEHEFLMGRINTIARREEVP
jgi:hypothetical protein